jgi:hypothetical protein
MPNRASTRDSRRRYDGMMKRIAALVPVCLLLAAAGETPPLMPAGDVTVTYRVVHAVAPGGPAKVTATYDVQGARLRTDNFIFPDAKSPYEGTIFNSKTKQFLNLRYGRRLVLESKDDLGVPGISLNAGMSFQRQGQATVNGTGCTEWAVTVPGKESWTACISADGVLLRSVSPTRELEAESVSFAPLRPDAFQVPNDLRRFQGAPATQLPMAATAPAK